MAKNKFLRSKNLAIIDYGAGNVKSVKNALNYLKVDSTITKKQREILDADKLIFPGVGNFGYIMENLRKKKIDYAIAKFIASGKPYLGICLGLQVLFEESEEAKGVKGLGIFKGKVVKFTNGKVPQIGWNKIIPIQKNSKNFLEGYAYFVNSYYAVPENKNIVATKTDYFGEFTSALQHENITAVQFHPEKSGEYGLKLLEQWLKC